tara:strand:- start:2701 stop:3075 length:375 start_codon:yes stop_codon:yes gene_type:complete
MTTHISSDTIPPTSPNTTQVALVDPADTVDPVDSIDSKEDMQANHNAWLNQMEAAYANANLEENEGMQYAILARQFENQEVVDEEPVYRHMPSNDYVEEERRAAWLAASNPPLIQRQKACSRLR